jgi:5-formyltetrahydrofolate cyclo-ligase
VPVGEVDLFIVPALRFDRAGRRLGRGGGHYDRLRRGRRADAWLVGIGYDDRVADELPEDPWDVRMHVVVAARFVLRVAAP